MLNKLSSMIGVQESVVYPEPQVECGNHCDIWDPYVYEEYICFNGWCEYQSCTC